MSRSKHTDPPQLRATRRLRKPRARRGDGDLRARRRWGRLLKELGVGPVRASLSPEPEQIGPRIVVRRLPSGLIHPAAKRDIERVIMFAGPRALYGLGTLDLACPPRTPPGVLPPFGRLEAPGRIFLFAQSRPPWRIRGVMGEKDVAGLIQAGAVITVRHDIGATFVDWPGATLRRFMLLHVLTHELGHHILQHETGKRPVRIARTQSHESFAERFAVAFRAEWARQGEAL